LLAIAQGGVENNQFVSHVHSWSKPASPSKNAKGPLRMAYGPFGKMFACATHPAREALAVVQTKKIS
jgi:hypothetical protein